MFLHVLCLRPRYDCPDTVLISISSCPHTAETDSWGKASSTKKRREKKNWQQGCHWLTSGPALSLTGLLLPSNENVSFTSRISCLARYAEFNSRSRGGKKERRIVRERNSAFVRLGRGKKRGWPWSQRFWHCINPFRGRSADRRCLKITWAHLRDDCSIYFTHSMQRTALCALDPELASKLGLRSFHGMRELIQGNSTGETIDRSLLNPLKKKGERARAIHSLLVFMIPARMYHGVISIRLFTCRFKYMHTCTDKTLPRVFHTDTLLTCISRLFTTFPFPSYRRAP